MENKILNREATILEIIKSCERNDDICIDINQFYEKIKNKDEKSDQFIIDSAILCDVEPVYTNLN
jgi:hypothetical protein